MDRHAVPFNKPLTSIVLPKICTVEKLISQLQPFLPSKYLTVVNGSTIVTYDSLDEIPLGTRCLEPNLSKPSNEYYIRDLVNNSLICCFDLRICERLLISPVKRPSSYTPSPLPPPRPTMLSTSLSPIRDHSLLDRKVNLCGDESIRNKLEKHLKKKSQSLSPNTERGDTKSHKVIDMTAPVDKAHVVITVEHLN